MKKNKIEEEKNKCLSKLRGAKDMETKLMWQTVFFWWLRNEDRLLK